MVLPGPPGGRVRRRRPFSYTNARSEHYARSGRSCVGAPPPGPLPARNERGGGNARWVRAHRQSSCRPRRAPPPPLRGRGGEPHPTLQIVIPKEAPRITRPRRRIRAPTEESTRLTWWPDLV